MIEREARDGVCTLRMCHGKANALDAELADALAAAFRAEAETDSRAVILTGSGRIFSAGVDLHRLLAGGATYTAELLRALDQMCQALFGFPKPLVAAINGHAIAGGAIILSCADHRVMARGAGRVGVPELRVGVPLPPLGLEVLRFALPGASIQEACFLRDTYDPDEALGRGWIDELIEPGALGARALEVARTLAALPAEAFSYTKEELRRPALQRGLDSNARNADRILDLWTAPETLAAVRSYVEQTLRVQD